MQSETVTEAIFTKLTLAGQLCVKNCADLHENPTDVSVADTRSQRDGQSGGRTIGRTDDRADGRSGGRTDGVST